jgi:predicted esterase
MAVKKAPKKALLCFHGTGAKASIFNVQMARICYQLSDTFEFIFIEGPRECAPGPGVLPMFSGQEPYYGWFGGHDVSIDDSIREINAAVQRGLDDWRKSNVDADVEIVGGVGFSEGGLALTLMLWLQQEQQQQQKQEEQVLLSTLPPLQFAAISCCFFPREASLWINARAQAQGKTTALIDVPTLHIHGNRDFCLGRARQLVRNHYQPQYATIVQVDTSHHLPTQKNDVAEVVKHIRNLASVEAA